MQQKSDLPKKANLAQMTDLTHLPQKTNLTNLPQKNGVPHKSYLPRQNDLLGKSDLTRLLPPDIFQVSQRKPTRPANNNVRKSKRPR